MKVTIARLNWLFFVVGITGVWLTTHSWTAMLWAFVASWHLTAKEQPK